MQVSFVNLLLNYFGKLAFIQLQYDGTVVAAHHMRKDFSAGDGGFQTAGYEKIVDTPACVILAGVEHIRPPAIDAGDISVHKPETVGKAAIQ